MNQTRKLEHVSKLNNAQVDLKNSLSLIIDKVIQSKLGVLLELTESNFKFSNLQINFDKISTRIQETIREEIILSFVELHSKEQLLQKELNLVRGYNWDKTLTVCLHYLEYYPNDLFFMSYQVESLQNLKRNSEADEIVTFILSKTAYCKEDNFAIGKTLGLVHKYTEAFPFILKSANCGFVPAYVYLGWMFENGHGTAIDLGETLKYNLLASNDSSVAQYNLGLIYYYEKGVDKNRDEAYKWWVKSALSGYKRSDYYLGIMFLEEKDYSKAFYHFSKAAEAQEPLSYVYLGEMYKLGQGVDVDLKEAFYWFERSAKEGDLSGILNLALAYYHGNGVTQSPESAFQWHKTGAEKGCNISQYNLGLHYSYGFGCEPDPVKSFNVFLESAKSGYEVAARQVASLYMQGIGVDQDRDQGVSWMKQCIAKSPSEFRNADCFHTDREIVLTVVKLDGMLLEYASQELRMDKQIVLTALRSNLKSVEFISEDLKQDSDVFILIHRMYKKLRPDQTNFADVDIFCETEKNMKFEIFESTKQKAIVLYEEFTNEQSRVLRFLQDKTNDLLDKMEHMNPETNLDLEEIERVNEIMRDLMKSFNK